MIYTTLNRIHEHTPFTGWRKLLEYLDKLTAMSTAAKFGL